MSRPPGRRSRWLPLLALPALQGCGAPPPIEPVDLALEVEGPVEPVAPGERFALTVRRVWRRTLEPAPFAERALLPLAVAPGEVLRRSDGERTEELRTYHAAALSLQDVVVKGPRLTAVPVGGGAERHVQAPSLRVRVRPALPADAPGDLEPPTLPPPVAARAPWLLAALGAAALLLLGALAQRRARARRRRAPAPAPAAPAPAPAPDPRATALAALAPLEAAAGPEASPAERCRAAVGAGEALRAYLAARFHQRTAEATTPEILRAPGGAGALPAAQREALARVLRGADRVKFAAHVPGSAEARMLLQEAAAFVEATAAPAGTRT